MTRNTPDTAKGPGTHRTAKDTRVAWIFPFLARTHYWQPVFREFSRLIPQTRVFTALWGGYASGYEGTFDLRLIQGARVVTLKTNESCEAYESTFSWTPLSIFKDLARFKPTVIFTTGFGIWTLCALLYKLLSNSMVIILWDGCSAHSTFQISWARQWFRRLMAPFIDFGVSNMREGVDYMRDVLGIPNEHLLAHPYQVADLAILDSVKSNPIFPEKTRPTFLFVGAINARKGWRYLLEAAGLLVKRGIDQFSVVIAGAGNQEKELLAGIHDYGLDQIVQYVGPVPYQEIASYYKEADVFVFPTTEDVWGLVLIEAMAFGLPVMCSKYAGAREMVQHEENGFIIDPRDAEAFAEYMSRLILDRKLIPEFGARSLSLIAPFTSTRAAEVLAAVALGARPAHEDFQGHDEVEPNRTMNSAHQPQWKVPSA